MTEELASGPRQNGWGGEQTQFPLKPKALAFLKQALKGPGARSPDASLASVIAKTPPSRLPPHPLASRDAETRIRHARGQSFPDWLAMRSGSFERLPDGVAPPTSSDEAGEALRWAGEAARCLKIVERAYGPPSVGRTP
jgi:alkyldihydroxyacetonephosphate synthase